VRDMPNGKEGCLMILNIDPKTHARLLAAVARDNEGREPKQTVEEWVTDWLHENIAASEDAAGLGCCEACEAIVPLDEMTAPDEDGARLCGACEQ
jgi:hypothetical protein